jgi:hypothetical protein
MKSHLLLTAASLAISACTGATDSIRIDDNTQGFDTTEFAAGARKTTLQEQGESEQNGYSTLYIKHHKAECEGFHVKLCYLVRSSTDQPWALMYDSIEGFDYQWGHHYQIHIYTQRKADRQPSDSEDSYQLVNVVEQSQYQHGRQSNLAVRTEHGGVKWQSAQLFTLWGEVDIACEANQCAALQTSIEQNQTVNLQLNHNSILNIPVLAQVTCADAPTAFSDTCGWPTYPE